MSSYYSAFNNSNGNTNPGNLGITNTTKISVVSNNGYTTTLNNGGIVAPVAATNTNTNVIGALAQPAFFGGINGNLLLNTNNVTDDGVFDVTGATGLNRNLPVNSVNNMLNDNVRFNVLNSSMLDSFGSGPVIAPTIGVNGIANY
jgi:hypothetical protein